MAVTKLLSLLRTAIPLLFLLLPVFAHAADESTRTASCQSCDEFNRLNTLVRDGGIDRRRAQQEIIRLLPALKAYYYENGGRDFGEKDWIFPLEGYDIRAIEGGKSHGFLPRGYDYFNGNRHGGHPAYDIFIHDRDQDERDDRSGEYVPVLSLTGGIVVAAETAWTPGSSLRGGKYLWIYDPAREALVYYAHNRELAVSVGDIVAPGDRIATVGRTGLNAYKRRSPTHLHFSYLTLREGYPRPKDIFTQLGRARRVRH